MPILVRTLKPNFQFGLSNTFEIDRIIKQSRDITIKHKSETFLLTKIVIFILLIALVLLSIKHRKFIIEKLKLFFNGR